MLILTAIILLEFWKTKNRPALKYEIMLKLDEKDDIFGNLRLFHRKKICKSGEWRQLWKEVNSGNCIFLQ
ncbi:MAG TPA: hypothetical protein VIY08_16025 [Candidatus Nitrosocosmicus sp.]